MKFLFVFTDMLRPNLLKSYNPKLIREGPLDDLIAGFGGTLFRRCYTPAPDTPRSLGCLHSGMYPSKNGCDTRIRWPFFFYKADTSLLESLADKGFQVKFYSTENKSNVGPVPKAAKAKISSFTCLSEFEDAVADDLGNENDAAYFLTLDDYHWANDDFGHNSLGDFYGQMRLRDYLCNFFSKNNKDSFDYIFWFSDHGHKLYSELKPVKETNLLNDDRTQIHLLVRRKNEHEISYDDELRAIIDIYPTVLSIIDDQVHQNIDGRDLLSPKGHDFIVFEDHKDFTVSLSQVIANWGVRTGKEAYFEGLDYRSMYDIAEDGSYTATDSTGAHTRFAEMIRKHSTSYATVKKQQAVLDYYAGLRSENGDFNFSDGRARTFKRKTMLFMVIRYLFKDLKKRWR